VLDGLRFFDHVALHNPMFFIFAILAVGMWLGSLRFKGLSLGPSGVLFVAIIFGHFFPIMVDNPNHPSAMAIATVSNVGLLLFAFAIGLQAGPRFFELFKKRGIQFLIVGLATACMAALASIVVTHVFGYRKELGLGLFTGALNCTPALAGEIDTARRLGFDDKIISVGFGLAYPFAAFFVVLLVQVLPAITRIPALQAMNQAQEAELKATHDRIIHRQTFKVTNPYYQSKTVADLLEGHRTNANVSRLKRAGVVLPVHPDTEIELDDVLLIVGTHDELSKLHPIGEQVDETLNIIDASGKDVIYKDLIVSRKDVFGKRLDAIHAWDEFHVVVTRIRRDNTEFLPTPGFIIEPADVVRAVGNEESVEALAKKIGREERRLDETSLLPFVAGIAVGILLGKIPIPLPGGVVVSLGMAGGPFTVALVLAKLGRIGPISAYVPNAAKFLARDLGLILFLAGTGAKAGSAFFQVLGHVGPMVVVAGALISLVAIATSFTLTFKIMKWNLLTASGALSATMFNPPALAAASELAPSTAPALGFASVYPISMISTIAAAQVLVLIMHALGR
jgi:putative transport protein